MGEFEARLEQILNNPDTMGQIMSLAQSLGGAAAGASPPPPAQQPAHAEGSADSSGPAAAGPALDPQLLSGIAALLGNLDQGDDDRAALLHALRPFVREERRAKLDQAARIARLTRLVRSALTLLHPEEGAHV